MHSFYTGQRLIILCTEIQRIAGTSRILGRFPNEAYIRIPQESGTILDIFRHKDFPYLTLFLYFLIHHVNAE